MKTTFEIAPQEDERLFFRSRLSPEIDREGWELFPSV